MPDDQILKLEPQNAFPVRQERERIKMEKPPFDDSPVRLDAFQVKPRIAVANPITFLAQGLAGLGIESAVLADETGMTQEMPLTYPKAMLKAQVLSLPTNIRPPHCSAHILR